ncbi:Ig-like domain-containing protein [Plebeiibacterium sediminum]|uniref:Ig-like domain-containing protein n=1 Tax=Plebeiibacterium sediminum TaxID=2992112 RepID=A0AAE3SDX5_9BACT|nr:Ig-like domain-containing protein [Plebeiobacterium sediminum]MCW3785730.1 Ig-like domain-containing protein [Plebeiobacterium sediminum]
MKKIYTLFLFLSLYIVGFGQSYTSGYPTVTNIGYTYCTLETSINADNYVTSFVVLPSSVSAPTMQNVLDWSYSGVDGNGNPLVSGTYGDIQPTGRFGPVSTANEIYTFDVSNLSGDTDYTVYLVSTTDWLVTSAIEAANPTQIQLRTSADYVQGYPFVNNITSTTCDIYTNIDAPLYETSFVILSATDPVPSIQNVLDWSYDGNGGSLPSGTYGDIQPLNRGNINSIDNTEYYISASNLSPNTSYVVYIVSSTDWSSGTAIETSVPTQIPFSTIAVATTPVINTYTPVQNATGVSINPSLQITFDQDVQFIAPTLEYKIFLRQGGNVIDEFIVSPGYVDGNLTFDGDQLTSDRLTITPYTTLDPNTEYNVIIPSGLIESLTGMPFNGITSSTGWRFWTAVEPIWAIGYPQVRNLTSTSVDMVGQTDKTGTYYYVVTANANAPTAAQIKAGLDETGIATVYTSGSGAMTNNTEFVQAIDISDSDLYLAGNTYYVHVIVTENVDLLDSSVETTSFTTLISSSPITTLTPVDGTTGVSIESDIQVLYDQPVRNTDASEITNLNVTSLITLETGGVGIPYTATISTDKTLITIVPDSNLPSNTVIDVSIAAVEGMDGSEQTESQNSSFTTDVFFTWTGAVSNVYTDINNWLDNNYASGKSVIIPATGTSPVIVSQFNEANNVIVEAGATLTIASGGELTVSNLFELQSSLDPVVGNANLMLDGSLNTDGATVHVQQKIGGPVNGVRESVYVSSPVSGATMANSDISYALYRRNAQAVQWESMGASEVMQPGIGYLAYGFTGETINFSGNINNSEVGPIATYFTTSPLNYGWNLVGNPFPCSIDWEYLSQNGYISNLDDEFYIYNDDVEIYGVYNTAGSEPRYVNLNNTNPGHIPSCHSFWVQVSIGQTDGMITFPRESRVDTHTSYLKNSKVIESQQLRFVGENSNGLKDELLITFDSEAADDDDLLDSEKRFSGNNALLQLYTEHSNKDYVIDSYNNYEGGKIIGLSYQTGGAGTYKIKLSEQVNFHKNAVVKLEDVITGDLTELNVGDEYEFNTEAGSYNNRFVLHIIPNITTDINTQQTGAINIYSANEVVYIDVPVLTKPYYEFFDVSGKLLQSGNLSSDSLNKIVSKSSGLIIVKVIGKERTYTQKVIVKK